MDDDQTVTGDLLQDHLLRTDKILEKKQGVSNYERQNFENQRLILKMLEVINRRVNIMYREYEDIQASKNRWEPRAWSIVDNAIKWGLIAVLTYLFINKP
jgi:hypothetical protein